MTKASAAKPWSACPICAGELRERPSYRLPPWGVHVCRGCGHGVTLPVPGPDDLTALYSSAQYYDLRGIAAPESLDELRRRVESLRTRVGGHTLLDVGAGAGGLLAAASELGYEVAGTEISEAGVQMARERFGLSLRLGPFGPQQFSSDERFDVVTMLHVLEHLPDPLGALALARTLLGSQGVLFIEVPNRLAFSARFPGRWARQVFDLPAHLHHFTPRSLEGALIRVGLAPVEVRSSIPGPLDSGLARAARWGRALRALKGGGPHARASGVPSASPLAGPAAPVGPSAGARLLEWCRSHVPGYKITAFAGPPK